jgi:hypothetical protein
LQYELGVEWVRLGEVDAINLIVLRLFHEVFESIVEFREGMLGRGFWPHGTGRGLDGLSRGCGGWYGGSRCG